MSVSAETELKLGRIRRHKSYLMDQLQIEMTAGKPIGSNLRKA